MADDKARIIASLEGADQVAGEAKKIENSLTTAGKGIEGKLGGALKSVGSALGDVIKGGFTAAGIFQTISLAKAVEEAKRFDEVTTRFSQAAGVGADKLKASFEGLEGRLLTSAPAMADFSKALGRATYDAKGSVEALQGLGVEALATGRTLDEELDIGKALHNSLGVVGDTTAELDKLRAMAEAVSTVGGHVAFKDTLTALASQLQNVSAEADGTKHHTEALIAVLTKGLQPAQAQRVGAAALDTIRSRALDIERATGHRVLDDNGNLVNPEQNLKDLKGIAQRRFGKNNEAMRRALISDFGADLGLAIYRSDLSQVDKVAGVQGTGKTAQEAESFRNTDAAKRLAAQQQKDAALRKAGEKLLSLHDAMTDYLGVPGTLALEGTLGLGGGGLATKALGTGARAAGSAVAGTLGVGGALGVAGMIAGPAAVLNEIGQDRESMGRDWRSSHAGVVGAEMARKAREEGGITPEIYGLAHGDKDAVKDMLTILNKQKEQLPADFAEQVGRAVAAEFRKAPMVLRLPEDPNAESGN